MDGKYIGTEGNSGNYLTINNDNNEMDLLIGNCQFLGKVVERSDHWVIIATGQDGICDLVDNAFLNREVGKITPVKGALANSSRVLKALVNFNIASMSKFSGIYQIP